MTFDDDTGEVCVDGWSGVWVAVEVDGCMWERAKLLGCLWYNAAVRGTFHTQHGSLSTMGLA